MSSDTDEAHLQHLATTVNERIQALGARAARTASPAQLLAVVALGLAEDLRASEERRVALHDKTKKVVTNAIERIDRRLEVDQLLMDEIHKPR